MRFDGHLCTFVTASEDVSLGSVLRVSSTTDRQVELTTSNGEISVIGVAAEAASAGSRFCMVVGGEFQVLVFSTITRGDFIKTAGTFDGTAIANGTGGDTGDFAIATNTDTNPDVKLVWARFKKAEVF